MQLCILWDLAKGRNCALFNSWYSDLQGQGRGRCLPRPLLPCQILDAFARVARLNIRIGWTGRIDGRGGFHERYPF
jgi:hypothetical protein